MGSVFKKMLAGSQGGGQARAKIKNAKGVFGDLGKGQKSGA